MIRWAAIVVLIFVSGSIHSQDIPGKSFGGHGNDFGLTFCQTDDGGYLLAGITRSFGAEGNDMYLVRINKDGMLLWSRTIGWKHQDAIRSAIAVDGGFILAGDVWDHGFWRQDIYMMKIDDQGNDVWGRYYGTNAHDIGFKVIPSDDEGYFILGYSRGMETTGDLFLIKTDSIGYQEWSHNYGSEYDDYGFDLLQEKNGDILMIGSKGGFFEDVHNNFLNTDADIYLIKTDDNGNELWQKTFGGNEHDFGQAMSATDDDGFYLFGSSQSNSAGSFDMILIKTDNEYNESWRKTFGGAGYEYGMSIDKNEQGELFLFGTSKSFGLNGSADFYLVKTDAAGEEIWNLGIGGDDVEFGQQVIATADSGCMVLGQTKSFGEGGFDFLLTKIDKNGLVEYFINDIDTAFEGDFVVYPNPVRGNGKIKFKSGPQHETYRMEILSLNGIVNNSTVVQSPDYNFPTHDLAPGLYVYRLISEKTSGTVFTGKLVVH